MACLFFGAPRRRAGRPLRRGPVGAGEAEAEGLEGPVEPEAPAGHPYLRQLQTLISTIGSLLLQEYSGTIISDPTLLKDFETERVGAAYSAIANFVPIWTGISVVFSCLAVLSSHMTVRMCLVAISPQVLTFGTSQFFTSCMQELVTRDLRRYGSALQLVCYLSNLAFRSMGAFEDIDRDQRFFQDRRFFTFMGAMIFFMAMFGYVPDSMFHLALCPAIAMSWLTYHWRVGQLNMSACLGAIAILLFAVGTRKVVSNVRKQHFLMARELEQTRNSLEQVMKSQQSMLGMIFDASCVCNSSGCIKQATPQMSQLLSQRGETLVGKRFATLGATPGEQTRLGKFLENAWKAGEDTRDCGEVADSVAPRHDVAGASARRSPASATFCSAEKHEIVFDAGSRNLKVISCSRLLKSAGLAARPCGLLDLMPQVPWISRAELADIFDEWVHAEVQKHTISGAPLSHVSRSMRLDIPPSEGISLTVKEAWLQFSGLDHVQADIPVSLRLQGVHVGPIGDLGTDAVGRRPAEAPSARLGPILENTPVEGRRRPRAAPEGHDVDARSRASDDTCTLLPDDSISIVS